MSSQKPMPRVDQSKEVDRTLQEYMRAAERHNLDRVRMLQKTRRNNLVSGLLLGAGVLGIYGYSMYAVRQEKFLDELDEPAQ